MTRLKRKKDLPSAHGTDVRFGTPEEVAQYRAQRLCGGVNTIIEVGAGAGFQTAAFAPLVDLIIAIDIDKERLGRARFAPNVKPIAGDALDPVVIEQARQAAKGRVVVFLDPQRPPASRSRTIGEIRPDLREFVQRYVPITEDIAIELPPFLQEVPFLSEREYLSVDGQLNRLTAYLGGLRRCDISVVRLPGGERIEHSGPLPQLRSTPVEQPRFVLVPDKALSHAGLTALALPAVCEQEDGFFLSAEPGSAFFRTYGVVAAGARAAIERRLRGCGKLILHGRMPPERQAKLLKELNRLCKGKQAMHLFIGGRWYLTRSRQGRR